MIQFNSELLGGFAAMIDKLIQAKAGLWVGKILTAVGLGFAAQHFIYDPLIDYAQGAWSSIPAGIASWLHALGIDTGLSILLSAYGIKGADRIFLVRRQQG